MGEHIYINEIGIEGAAVDILFFMRTMFDMDTKLTRFNSLIPMPEIKDLDEKYLNPVDNTKPLYSLWNMDHWGVFQDGVLKILPIDRVAQEAKETPLAKTYARICFLTKDTYPVLIYKKMKEFFKKLKFTFVFESEYDNIKGEYKPDGNLEIHPYNWEEEVESNFDYPDYD